MQIRSQFSMLRSSGPRSVIGLNAGYETLAGERGVTLSGGYSAARIDIAFAPFTNPRILILDDSTSAIDSATEDHIQRAMQASSAAPYDLQRLPTGSVVIGYGSYSLRREN